MSQKQRFETIEFQLRNIETRMTLLEGYILSISRSLENMESLFVKRNIFTSPSLVNQDETDTRDVKNVTKCSNSDVLRRAL